MKKLILAAGLATLMGGTALAQTATTPAGETATPAAGDTATPAAGDTATTAAPGTTNPVIVVLPPATQGAAPAHFLIDDLDDEDVYGADGNEIGDIEDFVVDVDGQIVAVVIEVGGFLGIGEKEVLVDWTALDIEVVDNDLRVNAPALTREELENAADVDVDSMVLGRN